MQSIGAVIVGLPPTLACSFGLFRTFHSPSLRATRNLTTRRAIGVLAMLLEVFVVIVVVSTLVVVTMLLLLRLELMHLLRACSELACISSHRH